MSIKDQNNDLPPIFIGKGFLASGEHPNYYPKDRLIKFLNLNPDNLKAVWEYCRNYMFFPRDISEGWLKGFQKEHKEISDFSKRAADKSLTDKDLRKINRILKNIRQERRFITGEEQSAINLDLGGYELSTDKKKQKYLLTVNKHRGSIVSLWDDLLRHIIENQDVRQCLRCGQFFEKVPHSHGQKFCTGTNCQNSYSHKKRYAKKNSKKIII